MATIVEVNNLTRCSINIRFLKNTAKTVLKEEIGEKFKGKAELSIALISPQKIKQLNKKYRKIAVQTDVLSFCEEGDFLAKMRAGQLDSHAYLGEIAINPSQVKKNAKSGEKNEKEELAWVVIHGVLHLLGYDHEKSPAGARAMREKEKKYLSAVGF